MDKITITEHPHIVKVDGICGIIVSRRLSISETLNRILKLFDKVSSDDLKNMLLWL
jgi:hypothetical protein